ncbi:phage minor head protein [Peribacillus asahii]|uniref:phage minor head protein n=1 Tax=Peribacillus asahii TaxID=228899 RepID=UPI00207A4AB2|nr:phage minor head protein [Peribacillus asahii]USK72671.1 phage head morphogenesis protein [Peribacillus asahii]USK72708.1 phage head morphogenesis protein [Peribacillus asahii]
MKWLDKLFKRTNQDLRKTVQNAIVSAVKRANYTGGRETLDKVSSLSFWYEGIISRNELRNSDIIEKLKIVRDVNPDASMAIWNVLRLANNGHELEAISPNGKVDKVATDQLNELASRVGKLYGGGADQLINVLLLSAFTSGAIALEVELNESVTDVVDFHAIEPFSLDYRKNKETGELELVQKQSSGEYKVLNQEQVFYYPIDPDINDPYGRSPMLPVLQVVFFQAQVLQDLKKAVHHFGYERFDISVVEEAIINNLPEHIKSGGPEIIADYVASYVTDIQEQMMDLEPDDDFFHTDSVKIDTIGGSGGRSMDAKAVIDVINQQMVTSLKQLPILLGRNEGTTETHGTIQWQIYVAGIESIRRSIKRLLERAYNVALQVYGKQLRARLEFEPIRVNDRKADAEAEEVETRVKIQQVNQGWITNDEASNAIVGHDAVDEPKQQVTTSISVPMNPVDQEQEDEAERIFGQKKTRDLDFSVDIKESWASDLEKIVKSSFQKYKRALRNQRNLYKERLKNAEDIPSRILADIAGLRSIKRAEKPEPTEEFKKWLKLNITFDSYAQEEKIREVIRETITEAVETVGVKALAELTTEFNFNMLDRLLLAWILEASTRSAELIQGVTDQLVLMTLWDVVYEGRYSVTKLAEALQESFAFSESRAITIARTEVITAGRAGQYFSDTQSGMVIGKKWRAAIQNRTRHAHREADGQVVALNEPFIVNGEKMMFPGDASMGASADNLINCRCWYKRILEGEEME